ncbi:unnamed protein product [Schistocephalus solidus]|uniref:Uncharacterized protein n=1 Tax=Schistocephalus solidus TaxID=70667 RepID=A0A183TK16_SCHSO|nr:unnamed protein product [Schistocephalus solidus]
MAANLPTSLTPTTIIEHLRCEPGHSLMLWVSHATRTERRQHAGESVVDFQQHLHILARPAYPKKPFTEIVARILPNFVDWISLPKSRRQLLRNPPGSIKVALDIARHETLQSMSSPWDSDRVTTSAPRRLKGNGTLLSLLLLGADLYSPTLLGTALHSPPILCESHQNHLDVGTGDNNVVVRPTLRLPQLFI